MNDYGTQAEPAAPGRGLGVRIAQDLRGAVIPAAVTAWIVIAVDSIADFAL